MTNCLASQIRCPMNKWSKRNTEVLLSRSFHQNPTQCERKVGNVK
jgi:hypothetical protein